MSYSVLNSEDCTDTSNRSHSATVRGHFIFTRSCGFKVRTEVPNQRISSIDQGTQSTLIKLQHKIHFFFQKAVLIRCV